MIIKSIRPKLAKNQSGMASILIAMISMIVISLIVLGFSQISQHEQRATLDRILSTQALYAAESGINDAQSVIQPDLQNGTAIPAKNSCITSPSASPSYPFNSTLDSSSNVSYTCLLVNPGPQHLQYNPITDLAKVIQIQSTSATPINQLMLSWQNADSSGNFSACPTYPVFPPQSSWNCGAGVLRMDIVPFNNLNTDLTVFLYPEAGSPNQFGGQGGVGGVNYSGHGASIQGTIIPAYCNTTTNSAAMPNWCNVEIYNLNSSSGVDGGYYLRIKNVYDKDQNLTLTAPAASGDTTCLAGPSCVLYSLINDEILVDSTGQAQDVLKRIQAMVPVSSLNSIVEPDAAIQTSNSLCKQIFVNNNSSPVNYVDPPVDVSPATCSL